MNQGRAPREDWKRFRCGIFCPGCPCCGSVKLSRELKIRQRRQHLKRATRRRMQEKLRADRRTDLNTRKGVKPWDTGDEPRNTDDSRLENGGTLATRLSAGTAESTCIRSR